MPFDWTITKIWLKKYFPSLDAWQSFAHFQSLSVSKLWVRAQANENLRRKRFCRFTCGILDSLFQKWYKNTKAFSLEAQLQILLLCCQYHPGGLSLGGCSGSEVWMWRLWGLSVVSVRHWEASMWTVVWICVCLCWDLWPLKEVFVRGSCGRSLHEVCVDLCHRSLWVVTIWFSVRGLCHRSLC